MDSTPNIAKIGALLGDNTRARMLSTLMHGKALTASELAREAGVTAQTATSHLAKLEAGGLLTLRKQGRHKYFALASDEVAALLETLMGLSTRDKPLRTLTGPRDAALRNARVCYNHLAGNKGIQLHDSLLASRYLVLRSGVLTLSRKGQRFMQEFGIDLDSLQASRSPLCRECLDWSERRSHLAGSLGRALFAQFEFLHWVKRDSSSRIVRFSARGEQAFNATFSL
ncbi:MAG: winged helix-turn-helix transcriptional regulator [Candidatus Competibacteraceae bacterium]|nr:winged helix-turn-helix transcriptional regulator [Candidatus Competibacteraceae bacterium]